MRKAKLIEQNSLLFGEVEALRREIKELKEKLDSANGEIEALKSEQAPEAENTSAEITLPIDKVEKTLLANTAGDSVSEYAAAAIGKIVVAAASVTGKLSENGGSCAERTNSVLGKAEVAKSDILNAVSGDGDEREKKNKIDCIVENTQKYFEGMEALRI